MTRRAYVYFVLIFLLGVIIGCAGTYMYGWYEGRWHKRHQRPTPERVAHYLERELNLSDSQTQQARQIIVKMQQKDAQVHQQMEPQFRANMEEARNRMRAILNPQQLEKFNEMVKRWDKLRKTRHHP